MDPATFEAFTEARGAFATSSRITISGSSSRQEANRRSSTTSAGYRTPTIISPWPSMVPGGQPFCTGTAIWSNSPSSPRPHSSASRPIEPRSFSTEPRSVPGCRRWSRARAPGGPSRPAARCDRQPGVLGLDRGPALLARRASRGPQVHPAPPGRCHPGSRARSWPARIAGGHFSRPVAAPRDGPSAARARTPARPRFATTGGRHRVGPRHHLSATQAPNPSVADRHRGAKLDCPG